MGEERNSHFLVAKVSKRKTKSPVGETMKEGLHPKKGRHLTIAFDNGLEFADHEEHDHCS